MFGFSFTEKRNVDQIVSEHFDFLTHRPDAHKLGPEYDTSKLSSMFPEKAIWEVGGVLFLFYKTERLHLTLGNRAHSGKFIGFSLAVASMRNRPVDPYAQPSPRTLAAQLRENWTALMTSFSDPAFCETYEQARELAHSSAPAPHS
ncbi:hypothetical protein [Terriglobus sp.]|uniref:hypothetical protein n=1 Tax=Terriglobus sp. TaxID=1889013 RepID=UPI003B00D622